MERTSTFFAKIVCAVSVAVCAAAAYAQAGTATAAPVQSSPVTTQQTGVPSLPDPRRPEAQPSLTEDRDPVPSPDMEIPKEAAEIPAINAQGKEIPKGQGGVFTVHQDVNEVLLSCTVIDEKGRTVEGLSASDFRVWEDNAPQRITSFRHQDLPVSIGILIDNSSSMRDKRATVNQAAIHLLQNSNREDTTFVVNFSDRAYLDQGFTSDLVALSRGLSHYDAKGMTAMYDAVAASADELSKDAKFQKQVLLVVSDGADNASRLSREEAIRRVQNLGGPVVYSIGLLFDSDPRESQRASAALESLSDETGGVAYFPRSLDEVNQIAGQVAQDIRNQYTIGYHSTRAASLGGYRIVHVEVNGRGREKLTVRTRRGYYARAQQNRQAAQASSPQQPPQ